MNILKKLGLESSINIDSNTMDLSESQAQVINEVKNFGIDSVYFNLDQDSDTHFPAIFIKKILNFELDTLQEIAIIHKKIWNYKNILFLYVYSDTEIRIYNCTTPPIIPRKDIVNLSQELKEREVQTYSFNDKIQLSELTKLFSRIAIDTGIIWSLEEAKFVRDKINLQQRVDKFLVESLINTAEQLKNAGLEMDFIHKIILRSLFLLYLEDRNATDIQFYSSIKKNATSYFNILDDVSSTYKVFKKLEEHFNGNVFSVDEDEFIIAEQLQLIKKCFISGNYATPQIDLLENWRIFDFSIIQIELLSEIYESFLFKTDPSLKRKTGTYYTPPSLVEFILNEKLPINNKQTDYNVKILDPSCGSGIFLVESFKRLVKRYENKHNVTLTDFSILKKLLTDNIYGIEIHPQAIKVAAFSLYLALLDKLNPKTIWQNIDHCLPNLINNPNDPTIKRQGNNLFCRDTISESFTLSVDINLIVGNPPFGTTELSESITNYCNKFSFAKEMVLPFLHKAITLAPDGEIALIFNTKVLTNTGTGYSNFRKWLFNECYVEKIFNFSILRKAKKNFGGQLFGNATGPISIIYYQKKAKNYSESILYYAPKTYIKSNIIEGLSIDSTDLKYLPRQECKNPHSKIWKVAMWGNMSDWELIKKLDSLDDINSFTEKNHIKSGVGFQLLTHSKDSPKRSNLLSNLKYLDSDHILQYYTPQSFLGCIKNSIKTQKAIDFYKKFYKVRDISELTEITDFRRLGDQEAYINPHVLLKKGLEQNRICASFVDENCSFRDGVYGFYSTNKNNHDALYFLIAYLNSKLSTYYLFMTNSSYGVEREQIMKNEYLSIPVNLNRNFYHQLVEAGKFVVESLKNKKILTNYINECELQQYIEKKIDHIIYESLNLTTAEIASINDIINYDIDLFHKQERSIALETVDLQHIKKYSKIISQELNDFIQDQGIFANIVIYNIHSYTSLMMIKITHSDIQKNITISEEDINTELRKLDKHVWEKTSTNIYFRKKINYKNKNNIYIIRPNQQRFWSHSMALKDAYDLILEILSGN